MATGAMPWKKGEVPSSGGKTVWLPNHHVFLTISVMIWRFLSPQASSADCWESAWTSQNAPAHVKHKSLKWLWRPVNQPRWLYLAPFNQNWCYPTCDTWLLLLLIIITSTFCTFVETPWGHRSTPDQRRSASSKLILAWCHTICRWYAVFSVMSAESVGSASPRLQVKSTVQPVSVKKHHMEQNTFSFFYKTLQRKT